MKNFDRKKIDTLEKYGLEEKYAIGLFVVMILVFIETIIAALGVANGDEQEVIKSLCHLIAIIGTSYYALVGYDKPHGNTLKNVMILFDITLIVKAILTEYEKTAFCCVAAAILLISYISGRLNKFKENTYIILVVLSLLAVEAFFIILANEVSFAFIMSAFEDFIIFGAISASYIVRYQIHRDAGLQEK